jgi:hypothetical protein
MRWRITRNPPSTPKGVDFMRASRAGMIFAKLVPAVSKTLTNWPVHWP